MAIIDVATYKDLDCMPRNGSIMTQLYISLYIIATLLNHLQLNSYSFTT